MRANPNNERIQYAEILLGLKKVQDRLRRIGVGHQDQDRLTEMSSACKRVLAAYEADGGWTQIEAPTDDHLQLVGAAELIRLFGQVATLRKLRTLDLHLRLLVRAGFGPPAAQVNSDASRKVFELLFGLACLAAFADLEIEDPDHADARNPNPDIKVQYEGRTFGLACKSITTKNPQGLIDTIATATSQIEKSDIDAGIVLIEISVVHHGFCKSAQGATPRGVMTASG